MDYLASRSLLSTFLHLLWRLIPSPPPLLASSPISTLQVLQEMLGDDLMIDSMGEGPLSPKVFCASLSLKTNPASLYIWRYVYA